MGTVLEPGEAADKPCVFEAIAPGLAMLYPAAYERGAVAEDALPGVHAWREEIECRPIDRRHLPVHGRHLVVLSDVDRRHLHPELVGWTLTGPRDSIRERLRELDQAGVHELVYSPMGSDVARELRAMAQAAGRA